MKKYKLKKDLPTVRAGEVFVRKTNETMQVDMLHRVDSEDVFLPPSINVDDINNFDEWFEEVKEFEEWTPKNSEWYKCLSNSGNITKFVHASSSDVGAHFISIGNCYPLDTSDKVIIKEQKLIPQAMHRLKMAAKKAWFEYDGSEGPDWSGIAQSKYFIEYRHNLSCFDIDIESSYQVLGQIYFPTEKSAQAYIDNNQDDLKLLFGVER